LSRSAAVPPARPAALRSRPGPVSSAEAEARHQRILTAARALFVLHGLAGTTLDAIAREARVTKRTIYLLYQNKEGLFVAVLSSCVDAIASAVRQTPDEADFESTLIGMAHSYTRALGDPETLAMYRLAIGESARVPAEARQAINFYGEHSALGVVTTLLERAQARGLVRFTSLDTFVQLFLDQILAPHFARWLLGGVPQGDDKPVAVSRFLKATDDLFIVTDREADK
jgi:AcrR family transcriptional regulator